jgi:hypothetical protein
MNTDKEKDEYFANQRDLNKTYFSKNFNNHYNKSEMKYAYKLLDHQGSEYIIKNETTLGYNHSGKRQLKALFYENDRKINKLILQQFGVDNTVPYKNSLKEASFTGEEVGRLYIFLKAIKEVQFPNDTTFNVTDTQLQKMLLDNNQVAQLIQHNIEKVQQALINNVTEKDIINFGYRKAQLEIFGKLLNEDGYFDTHKQITNNNSTQGDEAVWQKFFEKNTWILGYGLDYIFNTELDDKKLEQVTSGADVFSKGKRTDALLKSQGAINSLCFCELKLSSHKLLKQVKTAYRGESWQISDALAGAIAQVQKTVQKAIKQFSTKTEIKNDQDDLTGETLYLYHPKAFILIGDLNEFISDDRINENKFSAFEMFRKNLRNVEIVTYDELYQRAYHICHKKEV